MYRFFFQYTRLQQLLQLLKHDRFTPFGFVFSRIFPDRQSLLEAALDLAEMIASKSPVAVQGTKHNIVYARDHSVPESLHYMVSVCVCRVVLWVLCGFVGVVSDRACTPVVCGYVQCVSVVVVRIVLHCERIVPTTELTHSQALVLL